MSNLMNREKLVEKMRRAIQLRRARNEFVSSADLARAALAVAEPAVREWCAAQLITRADELRAMGTEKDTPDGVARECRSQSHALRVEAAILRTGGTP